MKKQITKQITFEGAGADSLAIEWLQKLSYCFNIKSAKIKEIKQLCLYRGKRVRLVVKYA